MRVGITAPIRSYLPPKPGESTCSSTAHPEPMFRHAKIVEVSRSDNWTNYQATPYLCAEL